MNRVQSDYTFLNDHSYSLRIDREKISLKQQREMKKQKHRRGNYKNKTTKRTVSIDRNSSDKENNSLVSLANNRNKKKMSTKKKTNKSHVVDTMENVPSLSIEERVKLRRTKPLPIAIIPISNPIKRKIPRTVKPQIKSKKFFLGSGLDLDNIVLGNRRRRSVQT